MDMQLERIIHVCDALIEEHLVIHGFRLDQHTDAGLFWDKLNEITAIAVQKAAQYAAESQYGWLTSNAANEVRVARACERRRLLETIRKGPKQ